MNKKSKLPIPLKYLLLLAAIAVGAFIYGTRNSGQQFTDSTIDNSDVVEQLLGGRLLVEPAASGKGNMSRFAGLAFIKDAESTDFDPSRLQQILHFRPRASDLESEIINQLLFSGKVERGSSVDAGVGIVGISLTENQIAEVIVKDEMSFSAPVNQSLAKKLAETAAQLPVGKELWYIESATLTSVTYKTFTKNSGKQSIDGTAFKANGEFYSSNEQFQYEPLVSLMALPISSIAVSAPQDAVGSPVPTSFNSMAKAKAEWQAVLRGEKEGLSFSISDSLKNLRAKKASSQFSESIRE